MWERESGVHLLCAAAVALLVLSASHAATKVAPSKHVDAPDEWFRTDEGRRIVDNIVSWQNANGGWWKAYDAGAPRPATPADAPPAKRGGNAWKHGSTFDNKATYTELRVLARAVRVTQDARYRDAFDRGLKYVFDAQYPNGGWPQRFPLGDDYGRHVTFNDGAMTNVMRLLADVARPTPDFAWTTDEQRARAKESFDRGVGCVLDAQIKVNGKLTGWCQQHDAQTLAPVGARAYELPGIAGAESADLVRMLMTVEHPDARLKQSIRAAAAWLEASRITGKRVGEGRDPVTSKSLGRVLLDDPAAGSLWARFYDIETNRPFFCGRDGVKRWVFEEVEAERRAGYAWFGQYGKQALKEYERWVATYGAADPATVN